MVRLKKNWVRPGVSLIFTAAIIIFVVQNWQKFVDSVRVMRSVPHSDFSASIPLLTLTFFLAAAAYSFLAFRRLKLRELFVVELAAAAINRLIPSGLGGLGLHGLYLHNRKHSTAQATAVVSINNLLGIFIHLSLLCAVIASGAAGQFRLGWQLKQGWILLGIVILVGALLLIAPVRKKLKQFGHNLLVSFKHYEKQPHKLAYAALALLALTLINLLILHLATRSFGVLLDAPSLFVVYTAGVFMGAAVPTPGGLAGVEAGLVGGFLAYGIAGTTALAIALSFRLVTYWVPIVPGFISLMICRRLKLL
ncbi:flippase-like domain-containing protein [Candidatus Saccharibacteria bacterium]|nr:MAG: flippase-like domain-containing protein [Candidatus Saccharibacteria bacterium]